VDVSTPMIPPVASLLTSSKRTPRFTVSRGPIAQSSCAYSESVRTSRLAPRVAIHCSSWLTPGVKTGMNRPMASTTGLPVVPYFTGLFLK
jgi:hypothetical protein